MFCIHCGKLHPDDAAFCIHCGKKIEPASCQIEPEIPQPGEVNPPEEHPRIQPMPVPEPVMPAQHMGKGSLKVPLIILAALSAVGLLLYFLFPGQNTVQADPQTYYPSRTEIDAPWFTNSFGSLYFYEDAYSGSNELTVPERIDGEPVSVIGDFCFSGCDRLTTVILPDTVKSIEYRAFSNCGSLRGIFIPEGVVRIGEEAFANCTALEAISIPSSMETIDASAFDGCTSLKFVYFSGTVEEWNSIYNGKADSIASVYCTDGQRPLR